MGREQRHLIVVGGGLAGIAAAQETERLGGRVTLVEASSSLGGRLKTDRHEGFLLDRGFQVLLSSYPEVKRLKVGKLLALQSFRSGALCRLEGKWQAIYNPIQHPAQFLRTVGKLPIGFWLDFCKLAAVCAWPKALLRSTASLLQRLSCSSAFTNAFLTPFFRGVFLDCELVAMSRLFQKYLRLFSIGRATLPKQGIQQFPSVLTERLRNVHMLLDSAVTAVHQRTVLLEDRSTIEGDGVIVALETPAITKLVPQVPARPSMSVTCLYYTAPQGVCSAQPLLYLGDGAPINNLCFPNTVQPSYAPPGYDLVSVTIVDPVWQNQADLNHHVEEALTRWFPICASQLTFLRRYDIAHALPLQEEMPPFFQQPNQGHLFVAGEPTQFASINGALASGKKAAKMAMHF